MGENLTEDELGALTLSDFERIAARLEAAARTVRDAQMLFGGGGGSRAAAEPSADPMTRVTDVASTPVSAQVLTADQQAELDRWRNSPARQALLDQLRGREPTNGVPE